MHDTKKEKMKCFYLFNAIPNNYKHFKKKKENKHKNEGYENFNEEYIFNLRQDYNFLNKNVESK